MVVDDDSFNIKLMRKVMSDNKFEADSAYNGQEAVEMFRKNVESNQLYAFILMDIDLPILNGYKTKSFFLEGREFFLVQHYKLIFLGIKK